MMFTHVSLIVGLQRCARSHERGSPPSLLRGKTTLNKLDKQPETLVSTGHRGVSASATLLLRGTDFLRRFFHVVLIVTTQFLED